MRLTSSTLVTAKTILASLIPAFFEHGQRRPVADNGHDVEPIADIFGSLRTGVDQHDVLYLFRKTLGKVETDLAAAHYDHQAHGYSVFGSPLRRWEATNGVGGGPGVTLTQADE